MREITKSLARWVRSRNVPERKLSVLKDAYRGDTCYILSCGPSMDDVWSDDLKKFLLDKFVMAVKQAYRLAPEICDLHIYNSVRMEKYDYKCSQTLTFGAWKEAEGSRSDILFPVFSETHEQSVVGSRDYAKNDLDRTFKRHWGPGVMFETGVYLPVYMGCKKIIVFGWDMNEEEQTHFYTGGKWYGDDAVSWECKTIPDSVPYLVKWLKSKGIDLQLCSPRSALNVSQVGVNDISGKDVKHGHMLIEDKQLNIRTGDCIAIEIGSSRECRSSEHIASYCAKRDMKFITVDIDKERIVSLTDSLGKISQKCIAVWSDGIEFLKNLKKKVSLAYMDAWDVDVKTYSAKPSIITNRESLQDVVGSDGIQFIRYLDDDVSLEQAEDGKYITTGCEKNRISENKHLECCKILCPKVIKGGYVVFDDTWTRNGELQGKGALGVPYLLDNGFFVFRQTKGAIVLKKR